LLIIGFKVVFIVICRKAIVERCGKDPVSRKGIMLTGKVYRSIGVVLALGGILYLFMATRINNGANVSG
jgi:hypothetical protein